MTNTHISPLNTGPFFWLMASVFVVALGYGIALPILPFFLERLLADPSRYSVSWHVGMMAGAYAFAMFLFAPLWGRLSDKVGRQPVILAGMGGFVVMLAMFGLSPNLWIAYATRILAGLFASSILPVASAYIADMGAPELRARRFAWMGTAGLFGFLAGPMLGAWLSDTSGQWLSSFAVRTGVDLVSMPFLVAAVLGATVWLLIYLEMPQYSGNAAVLPLTDKAFTAHNSRSVNLLLLLTLLMMFGLGSFEVGLTLHGQQILGFGPDRLSQMFVACMLVMIATQMLAFPFLIKRLPIHFIAPPAFAAMAGGLVLLPVALDFGWLLVAVGLVAAGSGLLAPIMGYGISLAAGTAQGAVLGKQAAASSLGQAIGSLVAGLGFGLLGPDLFWGTAGLLLIGVALGAGIPLLSVKSVIKSGVRL